MHTCRLGSPEAPTSSNEADEQQGTSTPTELSESERGAQEGKPWWQVWGGQNQKGAPVQEEGTAGSSAADSQSTGRSSSDGIGAEKQWWMFWVDPKADDKGATPSTSDPSSRSSGSNESGLGGKKGEKSSQASRPWWEFWKTGEEGEGQQRREGEEAGDFKHPHERSVDAIIIPPDLPLEDIAE